MGKIKPKETKMNVTYLILKRLILAFIIVFSISNYAFTQNDNDIKITHGPILGHITHNSVRIWGRTSKSGVFQVVYNEVGSLSNPESLNVSTKIENDNTGWVTITNLKPDTKYTYHLKAGNSKSEEGAFKTLPDAANYIDKKHNPKGLFNFSFEFGSCSNQNPKNGIGPSLPTYTTMLDKVRGEVDFAMMNGDWLYEELRDFPASKWLENNNLNTKTQPDVVKYAPTVVGVWENYKLYLDRAPNFPKVASSSKSPQFGRTITLPPSVPLLSKC